MKFGLELKKLVLKNRVNQVIISHLILSRVKGISNSIKKENKEDGGGECEGLEGAKELSTPIFSYLSERPSRNPLIVFQDFLLNRIGESNTRFVGYCAGLMLGLVLEIIVVMLLLKTGRL